MLFLANIAGYVALNWQKLLKIAGICVILIIIFAVLLQVRGCLNKPPKLDEKQIQKAQAAIEQRNDEKLKQILAESDTAADNIDSTILQAEQNTRNAVRNYDGWTAEQLAAEIERRK